MKRVVTGYGTIGSGVSQKHYRSTKIKIAERAGEEPNQRRLSKVQFDFKRISGDSDRNTR